MAIALIRPWGRRVPGWVVVVLAGGATGLLAPILVGLPLGGALQLVGTGALHTHGMDHLSPWVFALTYGGFGLLVIGIAVLAWCFALERWGRLLSAPPPRPRGRAIAVGALSMVAFGMAMTYWGLFGPGESGPRAMDALPQRTVLVVTGVLALVGWAVPLVAPRGLRPRTAWVLTWLGCTTAALQAPTQVLLANQGDPSPAIIVLALLTPAGSVAYGLSLPAPTDRGERSHDGPLDKSPLTRPGRGNVDGQGVTPRSAPPPPACPAATRARSPRRVLDLAALHLAGEEPAFWRRAHAARRSRESFTGHHAVAR
ncbi:hypothetical protein ACI79P_14630 [Blastococcus sp. SYSU DS0510]